MTTKLLALSPLTDANITTLEKYHVTVVTPENITPDDYSDIVISYGWRSKIINKILYGVKRLRSRWSLQMFHTNKNL